jgi:hypothetical protein
VSTFDRVRRLATVVLTTVVLLTATQWAQAGFTGSTTRDLEVGTASMAAPADVVGTFVCKQSLLLTHGVEFHLNDFTDAGPAGAQYQYHVYRANESQPTISQLSASRTATLDTGLLVGSGATWTLTIHSVLGNWTGPVWTRTVTCSGNSTGSL